MLSPGTIIAERYEIIALVGAGGMAEVYKAKCHKLNRFVAMKVLKREYNNDETFLRKFATEAQAAASISHPNIVSVYDVGTENDLYYIVMELVEGPTLKQYIAAHGPLDPRKAVDFTIQIASALETAHAQHIIHRDIKPQNIIVAQGETLKVADFGIARAATSGTITASDTVGSVHYISPEQAKGSISDERSDLYSLGICLYEMLVGEVPFDGENTVAVALMHLQDAMENPRNYNKEIPVSLVEVLEKCTQKLPVNRYENARLFIEDLRKVFIQPEGGFVKYPQEDVGGVTKIITEDEIAQIRSELVAEQENPVADDTEEAEEELEDGNDMDPKLEKVVIVLGVVAAVIVAMIAIFIIGKAIGAFSFKSGDLKNNTQQTTEQLDDSKTVTVPNLVGQSYSTAKATLASMNLNIKATLQESEKEQNEIIEQLTPVGSEVPEGSYIEVVISKGQSGGKVEDVEGLEADEATALLEAAGYTVEKEYDYSDSIKEGYVISQDPVAGSEVSGEGVVTITISKGSDQEREVPDVRNKTTKEAESLLEQAELTLGNVTEIYSDSVDKGYIISQGYSGGTKVEKGTSVDVTVSKGSEPVEEPATPTMYSGVVTIPESMNPFAKGETGNITVKVQDGTILDNRTMSSADFPMNYNVTGNTRGSVTVYVYLEGDLIGSANVTLD
ncbi:MAG: Stk1 family PASTA domain-containing Ser/Thr kinase [Lachnospiraceae bacterium]